jgi:hemerythrin superfamily protein
MRSTSKSKSAAPKAIDAIALLKADHKQVKTWFAEFEATKSSGKKAKLATQICAALTVHTEIEEQIFYPAFLAATRDKDMHHEAIIEHDGAKKLIAQIQASSPADDYFDSKVHVLSEMIKHHVKEEEQAGGMFAEARQAKKMDLNSLGAAMAERKNVLMAKTRATAPR